MVFIPISVYAAEETISHEERARSDEASNTGSFLMYDEIERADIVTGEPYLFLSSAEFRGESVSLLEGMRMVYTSGAFSEGTTLLREPEAIGAAQKMRYQSWIYDASADADDMELQFWDLTTGTVHAENSQMIALNLNNLTENTHYWFTQDTADYNVPAHPVLTNTANITLTLQTGHQYLLMGKQHMDCLVVAKTVVSFFSKDGAIFNTRQELKCEDTDEFFNMVQFMIVEGDGVSHNFGNMAFGFSGTNYKVLDSSFMILDLDAFSNTDGAELLHTLVQPIQ